MTPLPTRCVLTVVAALACAGCASAPVADPVPGTGPTIPAPPPAVRPVTYIAVPSDDRELTQCIRARRAEAAKTSQWRKYADRLERLLGIEPEDGDE